MKRAIVVLYLSVGAALIYGTARDPDFWSTPEQRGDALCRAGEYAEAAKIYRDPWHIGMAQYRNGDFKEAAPTFARVAGAEGAFDQGNAWLMHGAYDAAVASYDRALGFRPGWKEAKDNKALALARKAVIEGSAKNRAEEGKVDNTDDDTPDKVVFDLKGDDKKAEPEEMNGGALSDAELQATWLRRVQTTPRDFLRAKFASQASHVAPPAAQSRKAEGP